jgi:hypothetical protein
MGFEEACVDTLHLKRGGKFKMSTEYILTANGELYHWGIKGMKWGVRRYQNKDGSLTPAGKKRRAKLEAELDKIGGKSPEKKLAEMTDDEVAAKINRVRLENNLRDEIRRAEPKPAQPAQPQKTANQMAMDELREKVNRLQLEKQYRQLQEELNPKQESFMKERGKKALDDVLIPSAINVGKNYLEKTLKKKLGLETEDSLTKLEKKVRKLEAERKIKKYEKGGDDVDLDTTIANMQKILDKYDLETLKNISSAKTNVNNILSVKKDKD